jgi:hypothetical protein
VEKPFLDIGGIASDQRVRPDIYGTECRPDRSFQRSHLVPPELQWQSQIAPYWHAPAEKMAFKTMFRLRAADRRSE